MEVSTRLPRTLTEVLQVSILVTQLSLQHPYEDESRSKAAGPEDPGGPEGPEQRTNNPVLVLDLRGVLTFREPPSHVTGSDRFFSR